jgi:hypothetical protein
MHILNGNETASTTHRQLRKGFAKIGSKHLQKHKISVLSKPNTTVSHHNVNTPKQQMRHSGELKNG